MELDCEVIAKRFYQQKAMSASDRPAVLLAAEQRNSYGDSRGNDIEPEMGRERSC